MRQKTAVRLLPAEEEQKADSYGIPEFWVC
jgi:hypothetical protein